MSVFPKILDFVIDVFQIIEQLGLAAVFTQ